MHEKLVCRRADKSAVSLSEHWSCCSVKTAPSPSWNNVFLGDQASPREHFCVAEEKPTAVLLRLFYVLRVQNASWYAGLGYV